MHAFWLVLTYDLMEDRRIDDVIIKTFALCYSKMAESFENLDDILADWVNEDFEKSLVEAVDSYDKQEKERKSRFSVENDLTKLLEQSQSNATKRNTKWVVKLFQGKKPLLCFEINELNKQMLSEIDLFEKKNSLRKFYRFFYSCNIQGNVQVLFGLQSRSDDKKGLDFLRHFVSDLLITQFCFSFQSDCLFQDKRRSIQIWQWRDSLNQSKFFAKHSNQSVRFILYRQ